MTAILVHVIIVLATACAALTPTFLGEGVLVPYQLLNGIVPRSYPTLLSVNKRASRHTEPHLFPAQFPSPQPFLWHMGDVE